MGVQWEFNGRPSQQYVNILRCLGIEYTLCDLNLGSPILDNPQPSGNSHIILEIAVKTPNHTKPIEWPAQIWGVPHFIVPDHERILCILYLRKTPGRRHSITNQNSDLYNIGNLLNIYIYMRCQVTFIHRCTHAYMNCMHTFITYIQIS